MANSFVSIRTEGRAPARKQRVPREPWVPQVTQVPGPAGVYQVSSHDPAKPPHTVHAVEGTCDCTAFVVGHRVCSHLQAATARWDTDRPRLLQTPWPTRRPVRPVPRAVAEGRKGMQTCPGCQRTHWGPLAEVDWCSCRQGRPAPAAADDAPPAWAGGEGLAEVFGQEEHTGEEPDR